MRRNTTQKCKCECGVQLKESKSANVCAKGVPTMLGLAERRNHWLTHWLPAFGPRRVCVCVCSAMDERTSTPERKGDRQIPQVWMDHSCLHQGVISHTLTLLTVLECLRRWNNFHFNTWDVRTTQCEHCARKSVGGQRANRVELR